MVIPLRYLSGRAFFSRPRHFADMPNGTFGRGMVLTYDTENTHCKTLEISSLQKYKPGCIFSRVCYAGVKHIRGGKPFQIQAVAPSGLRNACWFCVAVGDQRGEDVPLKVMR